MRAVLIRDGDYYVGLRERMVRARKQQADLFVSIHADAFRNRNVRGSSVYVLSHGGATNEAARWLAERENAADLVGGVTLDDKDHQLRGVLLDLSQTATMEDSLEVADQVLAALQRVGAVHRDRVQAAGFMVLKSPDIPSLLVETAFISNPTEEQLLRDTRYRRKLAGAIRDGIVAHLRSSGQPQPRYARGRQHQVARGDTLSGIAARYEVSAQQILAANKRRDQTVRLGEILRIP
jgi:N-acetylmuramoyl-L-alanine amidase